MEYLPGASLLKLKFPFWSAVSVFDFSISVSVELAKGWPELALITLPVIFPDCAATLWEKIKNRKIKDIIRMKSNFCKGNGLLLHQYQEIVIQTLSFLAAFIHSLQIHHFPSEVFENNIKVIIK
jgi:hypothetical protein